MFTAKSTESPIQAPAGSAVFRLRHFLLMLSFLIWVIVPLVGTTLYLYTIALNQYASYVGFSVRTEEPSSAVGGLLGSLSEFSGTSSSDTDILYKFIQGREMIRAVDEKLDLQSVYSRPGDPVFTLSRGASIEDAEDYWQRMIKVYYDTGGGLIEVRVNAFTAEDAQAIARVLLDESGEMINELSAIAREDATRYAREELVRSEQRLKRARQEIDQFRARTQIIDPLADTQGHLGLLNSLQEQLANALIELDLLRQTSQDSDPRVTQSERRVDVIRIRIDAERERFGSSTEEDGDSFSKLVGEYGALSVDLEFAEKSYISALAAYDAAQAEAQRTSRYLAAFTKPTLAETPEYPQRFLLCLLIGSGLFFSWAIAAIIYYSVRDRR